MPAPTRYGLFDLLTLTERLLAPVITAAREEMWRPVPVMGFPITPPSDPAAGIPADALEGGSNPLSGQAIGAEAAGGTGVLKEEGIPADPLFVRRDRGKLIRYVEAEAGDPGERFRRRVKNGKARYERAT